MKKNNVSYENFARVYDELMDNVPYDEWAGELIKLLGDYEIKDGLVCELGCGTGNMTMRLFDAGFDMIGIDNAPDMLSIAREKQAETGRVDILYLLQDMREFELYGTVRAIISICDSVNYILEKDELLECFRLVNNYLDPKGIFIFDFNTEYKYRDVIGETVIAENRDDCSFIWENFYDEEERINEYDLTIFAQTEENLFEKFEETHYQRGYTLEEMKAIIDQAGLKFVKAYDFDTKQMCNEYSERICIVAMESGK